MKIARILISKLFGLYDYTIKFNDGVNIITGFNGYGKSTIFRIIHYIYTGSDKLDEIPFESVKILYDDATITCRRRGETKDDNIANEDAGVDDNCIYDRYLERGGKRESQDMFNLYMRSLDDLLVSDGRRFSKDTNINQCNKEISEILQSIAEKYNTERVMLMAQQMEYVKDNVSKDLFENEKRLYESHVTDLQLVQLMPIEEVKDGEFGDDLNNRLLYAMWKIENMAYDKVKDDVERLVILANLIEKSEFADKKFEYSKSIGIRFKSNNQDKSIIFVDKLSSGEQQRIILFYNLIFKAASNTLIMIDEPEISLHLAWQLNFVKELRAILNKNHQQVFLSTHSGEIVANNWDCVTDLYKLATK